jgi:sugar (pentulose or hexulose) kinase
VPSSVRGAALTVAGHDHQAAALAVGAAAPGALLDSLGTAEALVRCVEGPLPRDVVGRLVARGASAGWGVVRGRSTVISGMRTGMVLERVAAALGATGRVARRRLGEEALDADPARLPDGVLVEDPDLGLTPGPLVHQRAPAAVWAAAVRDVTAVSARRLERIADDLGPHHRLTLAGGWARNAAVVAEKRRQLGPLDVSDLREAGATGAALLAGVAAGLLEPPDRDPSPVWSRRGVLSAESQC